MVIDLKTQLSYFKIVEKQLKHKLGDSRAKTLLSKAVYLFGIGSNDYISLSPSNSTVLQSIHSKNDHVKMVIGNLTSTIQEIYEKGGRKFGFLSLAPLGCILSLKVHEPGSGSTGSCLEEANELAKLHNKALSQALRKLETRLDGFRYANHDFYNSFSERINNPSRYGFKEVNLACCGSGRFREISSCGGKRGIEEYELCEDPSQYLFFESDHPNEKANKQIAELMWSGTPDVTGPYNLKTLFQQLCTLDPVMVELPSPSVFFFFLDQIQEIFNLLLRLFP